MTPRLAALALAGLVVGCSSNESPGSTGAPDDPCKDMIAECLGSQKACVAGADGPRCEPCAEGRYAAPTGSCEALEGEARVHDFDAFTTEAGEEVLGLCQSWTLNNPEEIWVNAVELVQDQASHHSNWMFVPDDHYEGPDGVWPCEERNYHQLDAALYGGVLYAQSTQAAHEVQKFPPGTAVRIPPYSRVIGDVHLLNTTDEPVTGHAKLAIYGLPKDEVKVKLVPFHLSYEGLDIPPHATSRFTGECAVGQKFPGAKMAAKIYYILPHTHAMASRFFVGILGGPRDGETLVEVKGFTSEAHGRAFDPPVDMAGADGYRFGCEYVNTRSEAVGWGFGDQEMCELLGFADETVAFESFVNTAEPDGAEGEVQLFTGPCDTTAYPWDFSSPGGPGPM